MSELLSGFASVTVSVADTCSAPKSPGCRRFLDHGPGTRRVLFYSFYLHKQQLLQIQYEWLMDDSDYELFFSCLNMESINCILSLREK